MQISFVECFSENAPHIYIIEQFIENLRLNNMIMWLDSFDLKKYRSIFYKNYVMYYT